MRKVASARGFTLIEILVAVLVLSLGVLGLVGLESFSLQNNQGAYHRSQATLLSYELADKIRANRSVDYSTVAGADNNCVSYTGAGSACSAIQIAEEDRFEWESRLASTLPFGGGSVFRSGDVYTISVNWDSDRDGAQDQAFSFDFEI